MWYSQDQTNTFLADGRSKKLLNETSNLHPNSGNLLFACRKQRVAYKYKTCRNYFHETEHYIMGTYRLHTTRLIYHWLKICWAKEYHEYPKDRTTDRIPISSLDFHVWKRWKLSVSEDWTTLLSFSAPNYLANQSTGITPIFITIHLRIVLSLNIWTRHFRKSNAMHFHSFALSASCS